MVKAFNTTGAENMADPQYGSLQASMFLCGDDAAAKSVVTQLGEELGFEIVDSGPLSNARLLEPLAFSGSTWPPGREWAGTSPSNCSGAKQYRYSRIAV